MAFNNQAGPSSQSFPPGHFSQYRTEARQTPQFDIVEWYPLFQSCRRYFLEVSQHTPPVQALAAFINIQLPYQKASTASANSPTRSGGGGGGGGAQDMSAHLRQPNIYPAPLAQAHAQATSLIPYIRRLVATGHDQPGVLHGLFGDDWQGGVAPLHEMERRNYLFAAKSASWMEVKQAYDMSQAETVPFLSSLKDATEKEIQGAEATWSEWLAMQDWMIGPRAPDGMSRSPRVKREPRD